MCDLTQGIIFNGPRRSKVCSFYGESPVIPSIANGDGRFSKLSRNGAKSVEVEATLP